MNYEYINSECPICLEDLDCLNNRTYRHVCKNAFHINCLANWYYYNDTCPICRNIISSHILIYITN